MQGQINQEVERPFYSFDDIAKYYDRTRQKKKKVINIIAKHILPFIKSDNMPIILEPGIGTGEIIYPFIREKCKIVGIDVSSRMLNIAADKYRKLGVDVSIYSTGNVDAPTSKINLYESEFLYGFSTSLKFDCILSNLFIHLNREWQSVIDKIIGLLKDDGIYVHLTERNDYFHLLAGLPTIFWTEEHPVRQVLFRYDEIRQTLGVLPLKDCVIGPYLPEVIVRYAKGKGLREEFALQPLNSETMYKSYFSIERLLYDIKHRTISSFMIVDSELNKIILKELNRFIRTKNLDPKKKYEQKTWYDLIILRKIDELVE